MQKLLERFWWACVHAVDTGLWLSLDDAIVPWNGNLGFSVCLPSKPHVIGVRMFVLSDPRSGLTYDLIMDCNDSTVLHNEHVLSATRSQVVGTETVTTYAEFRTAERPISGEKSDLVGQLSKSGCGSSKPGDMCYVAVP